MTIVNLFAGPGAGKSTIAADVFAKLKWMGVNCELASEYAKGKVWENSLDVLDDQIYIFGKQHHAIYRLMDRVDVVITDSPLPLSIIYGTKYGAIFAQLVLDIFNTYSNLNYFVVREKTYQPIGRLQSKDEAIALDTQIKLLLHNNGIHHQVVPGSPFTVYSIVDDVLRTLNAKP